MPDSKRRFIKRIGSATLLAGMLALASGLAHAGPTPHMFGSSFGLARDQTARVNVASVENPTTLGEATRFPPDPCMVELRVLDPDGSVIAQSQPRILRPGASFSHDVRFLELRGSRAIDPNNPNRAQLRVASYLVRASGRACPSDNGSLKLSVEVLDDASGRTQFMVPTDSFLPAIQ